MYQILLVVAKIYFDSIATFDFIYSGRVNKPRDIKGLFTKKISKSGYGSFMISLKKKIEIFPFLV